MDDSRLIASRVCDRRYRLRNGTAAGEFRAGRLPGRRTRRAIYVSAQVADRLFLTTTRTNQ